jgi:hypothetical protein
MLTIVNLALKIIHMKFDAQVEDALLALAAGLRLANPYQIHDLPICQQTEKLSSTKLESLV